MPAAEQRSDAPRVVLVAGKGGVGKTTVAAAISSVLTARGLRTLLVSTDPAHSTADLLEVRAGVEPVPVAPLWSLLQIDADQVARQHVARIADDARDVVPPDVLPALRRHLDAALASPGTHESALLDRLSDVLVDATAGGAWDRVVVDTAPTGHTLRLLMLPDLLSGWVEGLVRSRSAFLRTDALATGMAQPTNAAGPDRVLERLRARREQLTAMRDVLRRDAVVHLVVVPERLAVLETERTYETLRDGGLPLGLLVVNRVFPAGDHPFLTARAQHQAEELARVRTRFDLPTVELPHLAGDVRREDLQRLAVALRAAGV